MLHFTSNLARMARWLKSSPQNGMPLLAVWLVALAATLSLPLASAAQRSTLKSGAAGSQGDVAHPGGVTPEILKIPGGGGGSGDSSTTYTVTNGNDSGDGSLRDAVAQAQAGDTIDFTSGVTKVTLTSDEITLSQAITINGAGVTVTTPEENNGNFAFRLFCVTAGSDAAPVTINGLNMNGGGNEPNDTVDGGLGSQVAVEAGAVMLSNCTLYSSEQTAIYIISGAEAKLAGSKLVNNGFNPSTALVNYGTLAITGGELSGNIANSGPAGALANYGPATITGVDFSGNTGNSLSEDAGAIYNQSTLTMTACLFTGNSSEFYANPGTSGALYNYQGGTATITGCTFAGNNNVSLGSAIFNDSSSSLILDSDIFYGDTQVLPHADPTNEIEGQYTASYCDIDGLADGTPAVPDANHNFSADPQFAGSSSPDNPDSLQDGSPCVGAGDPALAGTVDILGVTRPNPPTIGAYEGTPLPTSTSLALAPGTPSTVNQGMPVSVTATVANTEGGTNADSSIAPAGTVNFYSNGNLVSSGVALTPAASGQPQATASYAYTALPSGSDDLTAVYIPAAASYATSGSAQVIETVLASTVTTLQSGPNPSQSG